MKVSVTQQGTLAMERSPGPCSRERHWNLGTRPSEALHPDVLSHAGEAGGQLQPGVRRGQHGSRTAGAL